MAINLKLVQFTEFDAKNLALARGFLNGLSILSITSYSSLANLDIKRSGILFSMISLLGQSDGI